MDNIKIHYSSERELTIPMIKSRQNTYTPGKKYHELKKWMTENTIHAFSTFTDDMPTKLQKFRPQPHFIYAIGDISLLSRPMLGIVGPRKNSPYADQVLQLLLEKAKTYDLVTVSGMARGVDALCHKYSIQNNIPTIAVLGGGLKRYMESRNRAQVEAIVEHGGLVISEFKLGLEPNKYTFPQRNRIIAGLADTVFLPEANQKSGSLITADYVTRYQKSLYIAPNSIFEPTSIGTNTLLKQQNCNPIDIGCNFLGQYFLQTSQKILTSELLDLSTDEKSIYECLLQSGTADTNYISLATEIEIGSLLMTLTNLELQGIVYESKPGQYSIAR